MSLKTKVAHTKWLPAGSPISYGGRYITRQPSFIVTLPFGYADGFQRSLSGKAAVLLRGHKIPLVGTICMDQCMADATSVPEARVGDEVVIWGQDQGLSIAADDVARSAGTIVNEVTALVSKRVPRLYSYQGRTVAVRTLLPPTDIIGSLVSDRLKQS
jgi:alanine racemase